MNLFITQLNKFQFFHVKNYPNCFQVKLAKEPKLDLLLNYPRDQPTISIHYADVEYLRPNEMLNDTIIEFYLKYIQMELVSSER